MRRTGEHFFRRGINAGDVEIPVKLNDRVHGAVYQPAQLFFAFTRLPPANGRSSAAARAANI